MRGLLDSAPQAHESWLKRKNTAAELLRRDCTELENIRSASCSITGDPQDLLLVLNCVLEEYPQIPEVVEYVEYVLVEALEHYLGVRIERRQIRYTTAHAMSEENERRTCALA